MDVFRFYLEMSGLIMKDEPKKILRDEKGYFVKGSAPPNPAGRPPFPPELKAVRKLSPALVAGMISRYARMTKGEIEAVIEDRTTRSIDLTICKILLKSVEDGDYSRLNFLLDRSIGKVKESVEISIPKPTIIERLDGSQMQLGHDKPKMIDAEYEDEGDS